MGGAPSERFMRKWVTQWAIVKAKQNIISGMLKKNSNVSLWMSKKRNTKRLKRRQMQQAKKSMDILKRPLMSEWSVNNNVLFPQTKV